MLQFEAGLELRVAHPNKGDAVSSILEGLHPDVKVAYLGDDLTDEDAFHTLTNRGLTVLVRRAFRETCAQTWLKPPHELIGFLEQYPSRCLLVDSRANFRNSMIDLEPQWATLRNACT